MVSTITTNEIVRIAELARLHLTETEIESFSKDLSEILDYMNQIDKVDVSNIKPTDSTLSLRTILRPDEEHQSLSLEQLLRNAAKVDKGYFSVPPVLDDS
jgi:aspartyl-tRNA(Asn)/glutamyl-tRNA(Gln) amidotransferase subunit C